MMKIGIYLQHGNGTGIGGAELMLAALANEWARDHDVDLVHHRPPLTRELLSAFSTERYERVRLRYVPREQEPSPDANPIRRYRAACEWHASLSAPYDLFVNGTHWLPPFCHARAGALLVLFPFYIRTPDTPEMQRLPAWKRVRHRAYYDFEWRRRLATYRHRLAISGFASDWARRRWGVRCQVVFPPVEVDIPPGPKDTLVLSVGRFATKSHTKKQIEMLQAFRELRRALPDAWTFACVGGLNDRPENQAYFARVRELAQGSGSFVGANLSRSEIRGLLSRARIFWHATGYGDDTDVHPEVAEHFGIATVEAMAAGCVPVVIDKGGQSEIVEHGRSGFLWKTLEDLKRYTKVLATDPACWSRMSAAAMERARLFARERFLLEMSAACDVGSRTPPLDRADHALHMPPAGHAGPATAPVVRR